MIVLEGKAYLVAGFHNAVLDIWGHSRYSPGAYVVKMGSREHEC